MSVEQSRTCLWFNQLFKITSRNSREAEGTHRETEKYIAEQTYICTNECMTIENNKNNWLTGFLFFEESTVSGADVFFTGSAFDSVGTTVAATTTTTKNHIRYSKKEESEDIRI